MEDRWRHELERASGRLVRWVRVQAGRVREAAYRASAATAEAARPAARALGRQARALSRRAAPALAPILARVRPAVRSWSAAVRREYSGLTLREAGRRVAREVAGSRHRRGAAWALVVTAWFALVVWARILVPLATTPYFFPAQRFTVLGFFENNAGGYFGDSLSALQQAPKNLFNSIAPFWYEVKADGQVEERGFRPEVVSFARSRGIRVVPMVSNAKATAGNSLGAISDPGLRRRVVDGLVAVAVDRGYDGLHITFALLPPEGRDSFTRFVEELASALHSVGRILSVSVFPDVGLPPEVSGFYDYRAIGAAADQVVLQVFDRHWTNTEPGPISPLSWAEASLDSLLGHVPAGKVVLGIGAHAYDWPEDPDLGLAEYLPTSAALRRAELVGAEVEFDPVSRQRTYTYEGSTGVNRVVWLQDAGHLADKVSLARSHGLAGVALWRLGFTEEGALETLARALGRGG